MSRIPVPRQHSHRPSTPTNNHNHTQPPNSNNQSPMASRSASRAAGARPNSVYTEEPATMSIPSPRNPSFQSSVSETRQRQGRKDEAIRKKIENELHRKRPGQKRTTNGPTGSAGGPRPKRQAGTVSALRPTPALTVPDSITVADASQLCAAKRTDCVLVVDEDEHLCGIFTAKDLAFRVIGDGMDPRTTPVSAIMTRNPMVTRDTTSATEALTTMVTRGFRHLPVCNDEGDVVGLLDITKVFHESLEKLERAYGSSQKLYNAIEGVQSEFGNGAPGSNSGSANPLMAYVEALRNKMSFPDLGSILDARTGAATVGVKTSVKEAAVLMREHHTTAVCVMENDGKRIAGIFTSKDIVLRVIAAGLDARTCSVVRVMTPHPDTALPSVSIQEALRKMHDGHYLNLPVVDETGQLQGCVDVLKLTYATLEQVNSISADVTQDDSGGPVWNRFFASFGQAGSVVDEDNTSIVSGSHVDRSEARPHTPHNRNKIGLDGHHTGLDTPGSELAPNDSASVVQDDYESAVAGRSGMQQSVVSSGQFSTMVPLDYDDGTYLFKFIAPSGSAHRFQARYDSYEFVREIIVGKIESDPFIAEHNPTGPNAIKPDAHDFQLAYLDDENDLVLMTADRDVTDAVNQAKKQRKDRVVLHLRGGKSWGDSELCKKKVVDQPVPTRLRAVTEAEETEQDENDPENHSFISARDRQSSPKTNKRKSLPADHSPNEPTLPGGIPKEMILPAAIGFLGVVILGVFLASKPGR
ncbi:hypothetical protein MJO28_005073 [Puccinia striiformis f. sp. tritici]|uniref:Uncharacterized protein n=2 Tax=Puccinia striiformis f. sp. tritici TaxID=168172 RepID=A0ACC0EJP0_9BASI|nr:hypothetical protein Pst134EB_010313 [Puccinia striiformis f. sp. tritici]KAI7954668.1 hypothetical protein MJO28_005068 [Puccinia striiformis f. sp. tritici]KAI7954673.1 hypothetical protein MJO28_005073 [Puccinia striiformis f. sp. tritici]